MSVAALTALYVLLLWLVSSMLRGKGILVAAAGDAALAASLVPAARGRRAPLYRLFFLTAVGDSMIYGHGVETERVRTSIFRVTATGRRVRCRRPPPGHGSEQ